MKRNASCPDSTRPTVTILTPTPTDAVSQVPPAGAPPPAGALIIPGAGGLNAATVVSTANVTGLRALVGALDRAPRPARPCSSWCR